MRIVVDARLNHYRRGGIPEYTRQLVSALAPIAAGDQIITLQHSEHRQPLVVAPNVRRSTIFTPPHHRFEQVSLPLELARLRPDLLHCPDFVAPARSPCPAVITVHDLAFMRYPEILDDDARRYYGQVQAAAQRAQGVIAVSEATRRDMVELLNLPAERINVVYEAADAAFQPRTVGESQQRTLGDHTLAVGSFALFVSTLEPRKNLTTLLQALRVCIDRRPSAGYRLAVVGAKGWRYQPIFDALEELRLGDHVLLLGSVPPDDLRWLYGACRLYANPSLYEGFGLPLLEALACGAPALVSNSSSLPEIAGDAAVLLPPQDVSAWADALEQLWHNDDHRAALSLAGPAQAARFSWQRAATETYAVYRRVAGLPVVEAVAAVVEPPPVAVASVPAPIAQVEAVATVVEPPPVVEVVRVPAPVVEAVTPVVVPPPVAVASVPAPVEVSSPVDPQGCLRCGASLAEGSLIPGLVWWQPTGGTAPRPLRALACLGCGHVELRLQES
jgi:glycosyltransferase involved in cell wall biosynthesis